MAVTTMTTFWLELKEIRLSPIGDSCGPSPLRSNEPYFRLIDSNPRRVGRQQRKPRTRRERMERTARRVAHEAARARRASARGVSVAELDAYEDAVRRLSPPKRFGGVDWAKDFTGTTETGRSSSLVSRAQRIGRAARRTP